MPMGSQIIPRDKLINVDNCTHSVIPYNGGLLVKKYHNAIQLITNQSGGSIVETGSPRHLF